MGEGEKVKLLLQKRKEGGKADYTHSFCFYCFLYSVAVVVALLSFDAKKKGKVGQIQSTLLFCLYVCVCLFKSTFVPADKQQEKRERER